MFESSKYAGLYLSNPRVLVSQLLRLQGYRDYTRIRPIIRNSAMEAILVLEENVIPQGFFLLEEIHSLHNGKLYLKSGAEFRCNAFDERLNSSTHLVFFILTLGEKIDWAINRSATSKVDPLAALFLETACWLGIEVVTREIRGILVRYANKARFRLGSRMAPGYTYKIRSKNKYSQWDLTDQVPLFDLFNEYQIPVELMESCAMLPRMSRSGVFPLKPC